MLKEGEIVFNGCSSLDMNLRLTEYPVIPQLNEEYEEVKIDGRSGTLYINKGTYENRVITCNFTLTSTNYNLDFDRVDEWLHDIEDDRFFIDRTDRCFRVVKIIQGDTQKEFRSLGSFPVTFIFEPFRCDPEETITTELSINNVGHFSIYPKIEIKATGDVSIITNGVIFQIKNTKGKTIIDSELMVCVDSDGIALKNYGNYPEFIKGKNVISTSGTITSITTTYRNLYR